MRPLLLAALLAAAAVATGADGGNASLPAGRRLAWGAGAEEDGERLPGWQGEQRRGGATPKRRRTSQGDTYAREDRERGTWMELIAWRPRAYVIHNLMSPEECVALVKTAKPFMARSTVVDSVTGESKVDPIRTRCAAPAWRKAALGLFCRKRVHTRPAARASAGARWGATCVLDAGMAARWARQRASRPVTRRMVWGASEGRRPRSGRLTLHARRCWARSEQTFLPRGQYDLVTKVEARALPAARPAALRALTRATAPSRRTQKRLARLTMLPWENGEDMQILKCVPQGAHSLPSPSPLACTPRACELLTHSRAHALTTQVRAWPEV
jgi:hypothetical protein